MKRKTNICLLTLLLTLLTFASTVNVHANNIEKQLGQYDGKVVQIFTALTTGSALTANSDGNLHLWGANNTPEQSFKFHFDNQKGAYQIWDMEKENVLSLVGSDLRMARNNQSLEQYWVLEQTTNGSYFILNYERRQMTLDVTGQNVRNGSAVISYPKHGGVNQQFDLFLVEDAPDVINDQSIQISSALASNRVLEVSDNSELHLWESNDSQSQRFILEHNSEKDAYQIFDVKKENVLTWRQSNPSNNRMIMQRNEQRPEQYWILEPKNNGTYNIMSYADRNMALDVSDSSTVNGTGIIVWPRSNNRNQEFYLPIDNSNNAESITLEGRGVPVNFVHEQRTMLTRSELQPTGYYVQEGDTITLHVSGTTNNLVWAVIGVPELNTPSKHRLSPGTNTITATNSGVLSLVNINPSGNIIVSIKSDLQRIPFFVLGEVTNADWERMMTEYDDVPVVQLKSDRSLITVRYDSARRYVTDPEELMAYYDSVIRIQDRISGEVEGVNTDPNYFHHIESDQGYMYATNGYMGYAGNEALRFLLTPSYEGISYPSGWGPWHEMGHQRQQHPWTWNAVVEATVNIYSLAVQEELSEDGKLRIDDYYPAIRRYLASSHRDFNALADHNQGVNFFVQLGMFWQLHLTFGEEFYPRLHEIYRQIDDSNLPTTDAARQQSFILETSKLAQINLIPFFEKWGFPIDGSTRNELNHLPLLDQDIWENDNENYITIELPGDPARPVDPDPEEPVDPDPEGPVDPDPEEPVDPDPERPVDPDPERPVDPDPEEPVDPDPEQPEVPEFDPNTIYFAGDIVSYQGNLYRAKWWTQGGSPATSSNWELIEARYEDGSVDFRLATAYRQGDLVRYEGRLYRARHWTQNVAPTGSASWEFVGYVQD